MSASPRPKLRRPAHAAFLLAASAALAIAQSPGNAPEERCGEVVTIRTHGETTTRYALAQPGGVDGGRERIALVLFAGGGGHVDLDARGCAREMKGNALVRTQALFRAAGFVTALVDAPSDHHGDAGLGGFRISPQHAEDLGKVIADVRARTKAPVWLVGSSRGTISAANAAARLTGPAAPDGLVLTSAVTSPARNPKLPWVAQSVFDLPLESIRVPLLVLGHEADQCIRTPAGLMDRIVARTNGAREELVTMTGGPGSRAGGAGVDACEGRSPHGFVEQEQEMVDAIVRFIRGGDARPRPSS